MLVEEESGSLCENTIEFQRMAPCIERLSHNLVVKRGVLVGGIAGSVGAGVPHVLVESSSVRDRGCGADGGDTDFALGRVGVLNVGVGWVGALEAPEPLADLPQLLLVGKVLLLGVGELAPGVSGQWRPRIEVDEAVPCARMRSEVEVEVELMRLEGEVVPLTRALAR